MRVTTRWLLNIGYCFALLLAAPAIAWSAWRTGKYREGFRQKLLGHVPRRTGDNPCVWLHAVSVGEVNLLGVLIDELGRRHPEWELVFSTTTKTGYDLARSKYGENHAVFYCPLDFSWSVDEAMHRLRPDLLLLAELELWPNLIDTAKRHGAAVAIVNGRLSENSFRGYRWAGGVIRNSLQQIDRIAAQDEASADRFRQLGALASSVTTTGSLKYDRAETDRNNPQTAELRCLTGWNEETVVWLAGSTQSPEEEICLNVFRELYDEHPELRLILVPRHPERFDEVARLLDQSRVAWIRRSELSEQGADGQVLLVDSVGELGAWWGMAQIGFVGGSFGNRGGQNMIEPAAYGVATSFGPNTRNFRDIVTALLEEDAARVVHNVGDLEAFVAGCLALPDEARALGDRSQKFVATQLGAVQRTADQIDTLLEAPNDPSIRNVA